MRDAAITRSRYGRGRSNRDRPRQRPGRDVHRQRQDDRIEEEPDQPVHGRHATQYAAGDLYVRNLESHAEDERELDEIEVIGIAFAREYEAAR
jgi:hypothetical protein